MAPPQTAREPLDRVDTGARVAVITVLKKIQFSVYQAASLFGWPLL
jgi:hypothetical protein